MPPLPKRVRVTAGVLAAAALATLVLQRVRTGEPQKSGRPDVPRELSSSATRDSARAGPLPTAITKRLATVERPPLSASVVRELIDRDETSALFVHARGVVTETYTRNVPYARLEIGEAHLLSTSDVQRFVDATWSAALALRGD